MTTSKRARFVGTSLLYLALGGMISSNLLYGANEVWNGNEHPENLPFHEKHFQSLWFLSGAVMLSIQLLRLIRSKFRTKAGVRPSLTKSFLCFGWAFGLQMKVLLLLILVYELALLKIKLFS